MYGWMSVVARYLRVLDNASRGTTCRLASNGIWVVVMMVIMMMIMMITHPMTK